MVLVQAVAASRQSSKPSSSSSSSRLRNQTVRRVAIGLCALFVLLQFHLFRIHTINSECDQALASSSSSKPRQQLPQQQQHHSQQQQQQQQQPRRRQEQHAFCKNFAIKHHHHHGLTTTRHIWQHYIDPILYEASIHPDDKVQRIHFKWIQKLLNLLSNPKNQRFQHGITTLPHHYPSLERIYDKLQKRLEYMIMMSHDGNSSRSSNTGGGDDQQPQQQTLKKKSTTRKNSTTHPSPPPPPLKILVFGGSIVEGIGCDEWSRKDLKVTKNDTSRTSAGKTLRTCAWPFRLEFFLNQIVQQLLFISSSSQKKHHKYDVPNSMEQPLKLVEVHNLAVGGTNSDAALPVLQYWLSDVFDPDGADIVINAYSANDNLPPAFHAYDNTTVDPFHSMRVWERNQDFITTAIAYARASTTSTSSSTTTSTVVSCEAQQQQQQQQQPASALSSSTPTFPIVFYVDDYLGNQQQSIVGEGQLQEVMTLLLREYQYLGLVGYVSVANMVRPYILANTTETVFSPKWIDKKGQYTVNVHFGLSMHVSVAWAVAYALLQTTLEFCEDDRFQMLKRRSSRRRSRQQPTHHGHNKDDVRGDIMSTSDRNCNRHEALPDRKTILAATKPSSMQFPPPGMSWADLSTITQLWNETSTNALLLEQKKKGHQPSSVCSSVSAATSSSAAAMSTASSASSSFHPCVFAFLAAPLGTHNQEDKLQNFLRHFVISPPTGLHAPGGWYAKNNFRHGGFQNKLGLVATRPHATVTFGIQHIPQPVRVLTIYYLKSYGPQWDNAQAQFTLDIFYNQTRTYTKQFILEGFHNSNTSISYGFRLDLLQDRQEQFFAEKKGAAAAATTTDKDVPPPNIVSHNSHNHQNDDIQQQDIAPIGSSIRFRLDLIGGTNFKITAMMFCSR